MLKDFRLKNFPISFFSVVMALAGYTITLQKFAEMYDLGMGCAIFFLGVSTITFILISAIFITKFFLFKKEVIKEFNSPIKINFFPTISISFLLLSIAFTPFSVFISKYLWLFGTILHFILTLSIISAWMDLDKFDVKHMNPSWFIPAVGNILIPISGVRYLSIDVSWFFFSVGFFFWIILLVIFFYRIFFHDPLPDKLLPTVFILIAPPAVAFVALFKLLNEINIFSTLLYFIALFFLFLILFQFKKFSGIKYYLSWWAYLFPLAAMEIATYLMYHSGRGIFYKYLFLLLFVILTSFLILVSIKTITHIKRKEICIEE